MSLIFQNELTQLWCGDCIDVVSNNIKPLSIDLVVTSPPYNLNIKYNQYKDNVPREKYLEWVGQVCQTLKAVLKDDGSFFLNIGSSSIDPWIDIDILQEVRKHFVLQNRITWVKSITIKKDSYGHFKPINSERFLNKTNEMLCHFTKSGNVKINKLAIGVPYADPINITRWGTKKALRCRGDSWFIPYHTIQNKSEKGNHPSIFPQQLVEWCIKLHGCNQDSVLLDPFVGSGTSVLAARKEGVQSIGIDLDSYYINNIKKQVASDLIIDII